MRVIPRMPGLAGRGMRPRLLGAALALLAAAAPAAVPDNRAIVERFARIFYGAKDPRHAFALYVAPDYVQHNPGIPDGRDAAIRFLVPLFSRPEGSFEVKRILVDGDLAAIHLLAHHVPGDRGTAVVDLYRLSHGKLVEHWDVLQPVPAKSANPHPMF